MPSSERVVLQLAAENEDLVLRDAVRAAGVSTWSLRRLRDDGLVRPVTNRVLAIGSQPLTRRRKLIAARLHAGPWSAISHLSAAESLGLPRLTTGRIEVTNPRDQPRRGPGLGPVHRSRDLGQSDIEEIDGIRHTNAARTLLDLALRLSFTHLDRCFQHACQQGLCTPKDVDELIAEVRRRGRPGIRRLLPLVELALDLPATESWLEAHFVRVVSGSRLPMPELQVEIHVDGRRYRVDALWPANRLIVELDGHATHSTRSDRQADAEREARLRLAGYVVLRFTYDDVVGRPAYVIAMIGRHLAAAC